MEDVVWLESLANMLKVTLLEEDERAVILKLEGRITGQWVHELERECERHLNKHRKLILDVSGITFVDDQGIKMLRTVVGDRVELIRCSLFLSGLLNNGGSTKA
jgi:anti-anti-sigma regulatory factor